MGIGQLCAVPAAWGDLCSAFEGHHHFDKITWHSNPAGHAKLLGFDHQAMQACLCKPGSCQGAAQWLPQDLQQLNISLDIQQTTNASAGGAPAAVWWTGSTAPKCREANGQALTCVGQCFALWSLTLWTAT